MDGVERWEIVQKCAFCAVDQRYMQKRGFQQKSVVCRCHHNKQRLALSYPSLCHVRQRGGAAAGLDPGMAAVVKSRTREEEESVFTAATSRVPTLQPATAS